MALAALRRGLLAISRPKTTSAVLSPIAGKAQRLSPEVAVTAVVCLTKATLRVVVSTEIIDG